MAGKDGFSKLERKAYLSYHQDGLIDIIIGLCTVGFGVNMLADNPAFTILGWLPVLFFAPLKNRITVPRFGYARFDSTRQGTARKASIALLFSGVLVLGVVMFFLFLPGMIPSAATAWLRDNFMLVLGWIAGAVFAMAAAVTGIRRFYAYAGLAVVVLGVANFVNFHEGWLVVALGGVVLASGISLLVRFMRKYPVEKGDLADEIE